MRFLLFLFAGALLAQQPAGVAPAWDTTQLFANLNLQSSRLQPLLKQLEPEEWVAAGAPGSYAALLASVATQNQSISGAHPDKLGDSLDLLLRIHFVETNLQTVLEGARKYGNSAVADLIAGVQAEGAPARLAFQQRVLDLARERDEQFAVADHEAQRCREFLSKSPHAVKSK